MLIQLNSKQSKLKDQLQEYFAGLISPELKAELSNPKTFFKDLEKLDRKIDSIGLFDQFSNTHHLEVIAMLK